jgi:hypothetical protein
MGIMMLAVLIIAVGVAVGVGFMAFRLVTRQLPPASAPDQDHRLAERIGVLEDEVQRVRDQADFTERLLTERADAQSGDAPDGDAPD